LAGGIRISDKAKTKKIQHSIYIAELQRAKARQQIVKAKAMKRKRSSTVEPVWGTLINFTGMKRLNARGLKAANKMLLLAATVYNLKKWLKFTAPKTNIKEIALVKTKTREGLCFIKTNLRKLIIGPMQRFNFSHLPLCFAKN
jgi:Transposase DDE domain